MCGVGALAGSEHTVADLELVWSGRIDGAVDTSKSRRRRRSGGRGSRGCSDHHAGELAAGDPGEGRLVLVFAADLEQVEEVGAAGADLDEVVVRVGLGGWESADCEVEGPGDIRGYLNGPHGVGVDWESYRGAAVERNGGCALGGEPWGSRVLVKFLCSNISRGKIYGPAKRETLTTSS